MGIQKFKCRVSTNREYEKPVIKSTSCINLWNNQLTKCDLFYKRNLYYVNLHIPKPHGSLWVAHTKSTWHFQCDQTTSNQQ